MDGENKYFFEEDADADSGTGVTFEEQADVFGNVLADAGIDSSLSSMTPLQAEPVKINMQQLSNGVLLVEYGIIGPDYVMHITPTHPQKNLTSSNKINLAIRITILELNKIVPYDLRVDIHTPKEEWDVKAISFLVRGGAEAWNLDIKSIDAVVPNIFNKITELCTKAL